MAKKITDIPGIGAATAILMDEQGFKSVLDVAKASSDMLVSVRGFGPVRAGHVIAAAKKLVGDSMPVKNETETNQETAAAEKIEAKGKAKSPKKKKVGKKDKPAKKKAKKKKEKVKEKKKELKSGKSSKKEKKKSGKKGKKSAKGKKKTK